MIRQIADIPRTLVLIKMPVFEWRDRVRLNQPRRLIPLSGT